MISAPQFPKYAVDLRTSPRSVLVVDSDSQSLRSVSTLLQLQGFRVLAASTVQQAKQLASRAFPIDVLLTDVDFPDLRGEELADWLHSMRGPVPVVFMSSDRRSHDRLRPCLFLDKNRLDHEVLINTIFGALSTEPHWLHTVPAAA